MQKQFILLIFLLFNFAVSTFQLRAVADEPVELVPLPVTLENGTKIEADGTFKLPNGLRLQPVIENGVIVSTKVFLPDGRELLFGQTATLNDGTVIQNDQNGNDQIDYQIDQ
jgi:hypothetical protein